MLETRFDWGRGVRTGVPEAIFSEGKTVDQIGAILDAARQRSASLLLTRLDADKAEKLRAEDLDYDPVSRTAILGSVSPVLPIDRPLAIVGAGTSDLPVILEAQRSALYLGMNAAVFADVGVAGLWRLEEIVPDLRGYALVIAVAGMEGALFSVLAGLLFAPVIAVPTSVGYGVGAGGNVALAAALCGCAPGILTVNIDNGFGAAAAARKILAVRSWSPGAHQ
ncbi:nickel pincer cofactor biosynthesis protein LarB [Telmatospirillum siberiense]|uniref:nickel pincer cofactor biosynthesis protein LarB n=1 Tax=Telmatospirillum siberiense TaxID=382514 RepID=UPI0018EA927C|nr:nickel pincer cofactor biosynthesis protein LarB [Telmatospirillum siberiense]